MHILIVVAHAVITVITFFFRFGNLHVVKRHAAHGEAMRFARWVPGHAPREISKKWCNLVRFGVYFGSDFVFKKFLKLLFFI